MQYVPLRYGDMVSWSISRARALAWRGVRAKRSIARPRSPSLPTPTDLPPHFRPPLCYHLAKQLLHRTSACMDQQRPPERKAKRAREEDHAPPPDFPFEEAGAGAGAVDVGEASGVFQFPWQKCRGGLGVSAAGGWELRDVFFRSLVDGGAAAIGVPGDRLVSPPPSRRALLEGVDAWLAAAADGEVDPVWRSALMARGSRMDGHGHVRPHGQHASGVSPAWH